MLHAEQPLENLLNDLNNPYSEAFKKEMALQMLQLEINEIMSRLIKIFVLEQKQKEQIENLNDTLRLQHEKEEAIRRMQKTDEELIQHRAVLPVLDKKDGKVTVEELTTRITELETKLESKEYKMLRHLEWAAATKDFYSDMKTFEFTLEGKPTITGEKINEKLNDIIYKQTPSPVDVVTKVCDSYEKTNLPVPSADIFAKKQTVCTSIKLFGDLADGNPADMLTMIKQENEQRKKRNLEKMEISKEQVKPFQTVLTDRKELAVARELLRQLEAEKRPDSTPRLGG